MKSLPKPFDVTGRILAPNVFENEEQSEIGVSHLVSEGVLTGTEWVNVREADGASMGFSHIRLLGRGGSTRVAQPRSEPTQC